MSLTTLSALVAVDENVDEDRLRAILAEAPEGSDKAQQQTMGAGQTQNVVLRVPEPASGELAFSLDNGKVWIVLRPQAGASQSKPSLVTLDRLLLGMPPIPVDRFLSEKRGLVNKVYRGGF